MSILDNTAVVDRTEALLKVKETPSLIQSLNVFRERMVNQDSVTFDIAQRSNTILSDKLRNVADTNTIADREFDQHTLHIPHFPQQSTLTRDQLMGIRDFDSEGQKALAKAIAEHLQDHSENIYQFLEYAYAQMLINGELVTDNYGTYSLAEEFGITRPTETFSYANPGDTLAQIRSAQNKAKAGLISGRASGYVMLASDDLFNWLLTGSGDLVRAFEMFLGTGSNPLMNSIGEVGAGYSAVSFGALTIVNYQDTFMRADGTQVQPLADGKGVLFPRARLGTAFYGPRSNLEGLSAGGQKMFAGTFTDPKMKYVEVESETNVLPIVESFGSVVEIDFV